MQPPLAATTRHAATHHHRESSSSIWQPVKPAGIKMAPQSRKWCVHSIISRKSQTDWPLPPHASLAAAARRSCSTSSCRQDSGSKNHQHFRRAAAATSTTTVAAASAGAGAIAQASATAAAVAHRAGVSAGAGGGRVCVEAAVPLVLHGHDTAVVAAAHRAARPAAAARCPCCAACGHQLCVAGNKVLLEPLLHVAADASALSVSGAANAARVSATAQGTRRTHHATAAAEAARRRAAAGRLANGSAAARRHRLTVVLMLLGVDASEVGIQRSLEQGRVAVAAKEADGGLHARAGGGGGRLAGEACRAHSSEAV